MRNCSHILILTQAAEFGNPHKSKICSVNGSKHGFRIEKAWSHAVHSLRKPAYIGFRVARNPVCINAEMYSVRTRRADYVARCNGCSDGNMRLFKPCINGCKTVFVTNIHGQTHAAALKHRNNGSCCRCLAVFAKSEARRS